MHRDTLDPQVEINTKIAKRPADDRTDGRTDILYCHSGDLNPWHAAARATRNYGPRK